MGGFVFCLFKYNNNLYSKIDITPESIFKLFYMSTFLGYDGYLKYNDEYMTRKNLREILGLSRSKFDIFFNYLRNKNIIVVDFYKNIRINQNYFCKGKIDNIKSNDFTRIYIKPMQHLFDNVDVRKHRQIGNFCRFIPYIHRNTVHNFINDMNSIRLENNELIITFTDNSDNFYKLPIIVNPKIFYGCNFDYLENKNDMLKWFLPVRNKL